MLLRHHRLIKIDVFWSKTCHLQRHAVLWNHDIKNTSLLNPFVQLYNFVEQCFDLYNIILEQVEWLQADETVYVRNFQWTLAGDLAMANIFRCSCNHYKDEEQISVLEISQNASVKNFFLGSSFSFLFFFISPFLLFFLKLFIIIDWRNTLYCVSLFSSLSPSLSL